MDWENLTNFVDIWPSTASNGEKNILKKGKKLQRAAHKQEVWSTKRKPEDTESFKVTTKQILSTLNESHEDKSNITTTTMDFLKYSV